MRRGLPWWLVVLAVLPAAAFVFVPQRAPRQRAQIDGTSARSVVKADPVGYIYTVNPDSLLGPARDGAGWRVAGQFEPVLEPTNQGVLTIGLTDGKRQLQAYDARGHLQWSHALGDESLLVPHPPADDEATDYGVADLLDAGTGRLTVLDLKTGAPRGERRLGAVIGEPVCVEDAMWVATRNEQGAEQVQLVDLVHGPSGEDRASRDAWPVPAGEHVRKLVWSAQGQLLLVHGQKTTWVLE